MKTLIKMDCAKIIETYLTGLKKDFRCIALKDMIKIITPYLYPDNDLIEIYVAQLENKKIKITDMGESFRHLHSQGYDIYASPKRQYLAETIASRVGVKILKGTLIKTTEQEYIYEAIFDMVTTIRGISDLIYLSKIYAPGEFIDDVKSYFDEKKIKYNYKVKVQGLSNRIYSIDFELFNGNPSYLHTLSPKEVSGIKPRVDATVRMWFDINSKIKKFSLLNDIDFIWKPEDINILNRVSNVLYWSKRDVFISAFL